MVQSRRPARKMITTKSPARPSLLMVQTAKIITGEMIAKIMKRNLSNHSLKTLEQVIKALFNSNFDGAQEIDLDADLGIDKLKKMVYTSFLNLSTPGPRPGRFPMWPGRRPRDRLAEDGLHQL